MLFGYFSSVFLLLVVVVTWKLELFCCVGIAQVNGIVLVFSLSSAQDHAGIVGSFFTLGSGCGWTRSNCSHHSSPPPSYVTGESRKHFCVYMNLDVCFMAICLFKGRIKHFDHTVSCITPVNKSCIKHVTSGCAEVFLSERHLVLIYRSPMLMQAALSFAFWIRFCQQYLITKKHLESIRKASMTEDWRLLPVL